ncbi:MAG: ABC transporter ATP-binding protein [Eubacteriales bacterium]|nr:ABC transporter ATP-binding protein [Eubacteriales bacterium]
MNDVLLDIQDLEVTYEVNNEVIRAVNRINIQLHKKETLGIVGEAGAGKTTTALSILGLLPKKIGFVKNGKILFKGQNLLDLEHELIRQIRGEVISMIFQDPMTSLNPVIPIGKQIAEVLEFHNSVYQNSLMSEKNKQKKTKAEIERLVEDILQMVGISPSRKHDYPHQLSGGMKQRVVIAIALICNPELLIADEPTSALDVTIQAQILSIMEDLKDKLDTSMIMITHDLGIVAETCDTVGIMYAGQIVEFGTIKDIFTGDRHHPYTVGLINSLPDIDSNQDRLKAIPGLMLSPTQITEGCKFHNRCPKCFDKCSTIEPNEYVKGSHRIKCHLFSCTD